MNWFAATIMVMWLSAALGSAAIKNWLPFLAALLATLAMGYGYAMGRC